MFSSLLCCHGGGRKKDINNDLKNDIDSPELFEKA
jgi:hypothetical protein